MNRGIIVQIVRSLLGVVIGVAVWIVLIMAMETLNFLAFAPDDAPGASEWGKLMEWMSEFEQDQERMCAWIRSVPIGAMTVLQMGWIGAVFVSSWVAARVAGRAHVWHALAIGGMVMVVTVQNIVELRSRDVILPIWLHGMGVVLPMPVAWLGGKLAAPRDEKSPTMPL